MTQISKLNLKNYFTTGKRPSQSDFTDLIESSLTIVDDKATDADIDAGISDEKYVTVLGAKKIARKNIKVNGVSADLATGNIILPATEVPLTFGAGLTRTLNSVSVNASQNITKLNNFITNGYLKTKSSDGSLEVISTIPGSDLTGIIPSSVFLASGQGGIGYPVGSGGANSQSGTKSSSVTLDKLAGEITLASSALAAGALVSFTLSNNKIGATDIIYLQHQSTGSLGSYDLYGRTAAGSATISIKNTTGGSLSEAIVIRFIVIKSAVS